MSLKQAENYIFLVDVNLPKRFFYFSSANFIHVVDINPAMNDLEIWNYALSHKYVVLTKDADFYDLYLACRESPKVIYFKIGNLTLAGLHEYFKNNWDILLNHLETSSFIVAGQARISIFS
jgi:predicted nuclease of predicted toxin-antitoxin system